MRNIETEGIQFKREELQKLYDQVTDRQQKFFDRMWGSVDKIPDGSIHIGFDQCQRTLIKNEGAKDEVER